MIRLRTALPALLMAAAAFGCRSDPGPSAAPGEILLVPHPRQVGVFEGSFRLGDRIRVAVASGEDEDLFAAGLLADELRSAGVRRVEVVSRKTGQIVLARCTARAELGDEGYRLDVTQHGARVTAPTAAGIFYGVQTLRQLICDGGIPAVSIVDRPAFRWRGVQDDLSRGPVPTLASLKRRVQTLAEYKANLYVLYMENVFDYGGHPLLSPHEASLTAAQARDLVAFARKHHVEVVPEQQSFGHMHGVLRFEKYFRLGELPYGNTLTPATPETYEFLRSLYEQVLPLFPGSFVHLGADEPRELGYGQAKPLADTMGIANLYVAHLLLLRRAIGGTGKQFLFWADEVMKHPEILSRLPADFVPAVWSYDSSEGFGEILRPFASAGRPFFVCPGTSNWSRAFPELEIAFPNIRGMILEGQRCGAVGTIACNWGDGGEALLGANWYPVIYSAAAGWQEGACDSTRFARAFDWVFFRKRGDEIAAAIQLVSQANGVVRTTADHLLDLDMLWGTPFESADREMLAPLLPRARDLRANQERAIELVENSRGRVARNADQLDHITFAARRLHHFGYKILCAWRAREAYEKARASRSDRESAQYLDLILGMAREGQADCLRLRAEYERLWLLENRAHALATVLARYDHESAMWLDQADRFRLLKSRRQKQQSLPAPEAVGLSRL